MFDVRLCLGSAYLVLADRPHREILRVGVREHQRRDGGRRHHGKRLAELDACQLRRLPRKPQREQVRRHKDQSITGSEDRQKEGTQMPVDVHKARKKKNFPGGGSLV